MDVLLVVAGIAAVTTAVGVVGFVVWWHSEGRSRSIAEAVWHCALFVNIVVLLFWEVQLATGGLRDALAVGVVVVAVGVGLVLTWPRRL